MKQIILLIIITLTVALSLQAQERLFFTEKPYERVTTDIQGVVYLTNDNQLESYSLDGRLLRNYSEQTAGNITTVDAGIASKILVFYRESGSIMLLNNELAPVGIPLKLFDKSLMTVSLAAMGSSNKMVLYDEVNQNLILTDLSLNIQSQSHITFPGEFHATDMQVVPEHRIALLDTIHGICLFDFFGTFEREIPIPGIERMQLMKDRIVYLRDGQLWRYNLPSSTAPISLQPIALEMPEILDFHIGKDVLYYIDTQHIVWKIPLGL
ncbi:MAG: hypothetical protein IKO09_06770 [Bacteroidales bacterium]|nr:hypothetical protein [Bacteroidales bacterium]